MRVRVYVSGVRYFFIGFCRLHTITSAQGQPWFAAYIACLLDPEWPIPGFSPEISAEIKQFLRSIEQDHFWTRHIFVPASAKSGGRVEVAAEFIERTVYESKTLLYTVQCMDY